MCGRSFTATTAGSARSSASPPRTGGCAHLSITGCRNSDGKLELITSRISTDGAVERLHTATGDDINGLAMCRLVIDCTDYVITAVRDDDNQLKLAAWQVMPSGRILRKAGADAGECDLVAISPIGPNGVVTYVRLADHRLKAIVWEVQSGEIVRLENHLTGTQMDDLSACAMDVDLTASAVRSGGTASMPASPGSRLRAASAANAEPAPYPIGGVRQPS